MWKFEVLSIPKLREMAAQDAERADVIIVSCHGSNELPADVRTWMELWLAEKRRPLALVALLDSPVEYPEQAEVIRNYLAQMAKRGQMEFFSQPYEWPAKRQEEPRVSIRPASPREEEALSTLSVVVQQDVGVARWDISE
jgi:hypothetical protein